MGFTAVGCGAVDRLKPSISVIGPEEGVRGVCWNGIFVIRLGASFPPYLAVCSASQTLPDSCRTEQKNWLVDNLSGYSSDHD